jgi:hypothetical protein
MRIFLPPSLFVCVTRCIGCRSVNPRSPQLIAQHGESFPTPSAFPIRSHKKWSAANPHTLIASACLINQCLIGEYPPVPASSPHQEPTLAAKSRGRSTAYNLILLITELLTATSIYTQESRESGAYSQLTTFNRLSLFLLSRKDASHLVYHRLSCHLRKAQ